MSAMNSWKILKPRFKGMIARRKKGVAGDEEADNALRENFSIGEDFGRSCVRKVDDAVEVMRRCGALKVLHNRYGLPDRVAACSKCAAEVTADCWFPQSPIAIKR
jgi:hypothetical protein